MEKRLFTSESVTEGHPDKICDAISDAILDALLEQDPMSRVACETCTTTGYVMVMGEITSNAHIDFQQVVRDTVREIGYDRAKYGFDADTCAVVTAIDKQSTDIAMGVDKALEAKESQEAVDNATNSLNKAIKALVKKGSSSVKKTDGTTNGSKTSGSDSVKTGDPASVLGWLGLAVSSLGAGMGGFAWKRRKRK